jgi:hypothetical protein
MNAIKTDLDALNFVVDALIQQNDKSMNNDEDCQYRGFLYSEVEKAMIEATTDDDDFDHDIFLNILLSQDAKAKCAIGHLISDDDYDNNIEGTGLDEEIMDIVRKSNPDWNMGIKSGDLLMRLQKTHDSLPVGRWEKEFNHIKNDFDDEGNYIGDQIIKEGKTA